jgi:hypothetical protein
LSLPVALSDQTPRGTLDVVFGSIGENGDDAAARSLFDPTGVITQVKLETR